MLRRSMFPHECPVPFHLTARNEHDSLANSVYLVDQEVTACRLREDQERLFRSSVYGSVLFPLLLRVLIPIDTSSEICNSRGRALRQGPDVPDEAELDAGVRCGWAHAPSGAGRRTHWLGTRPLMALEKSYRHL